MWNDRSAQERMCKMVIDANNEPFAQCKREKISIFLESSLALTESTPNQSANDKIEMIPYSRRRAYMIVRPSDSNCRYRRSFVAA